MSDHTTNLHMRTNSTHVRKSNGQALLIVVVFMGAVMLGISVISGFLFTQRLRTSVQITKSTQAIFAADAGIEAHLYDIFRGGCDGGPSPGFTSNSSETITSADPACGITTKAKFEATRDYEAAIGGFAISSLGISDGISRQLRLDLIIFGSD